MLLFSSLSLSATTPALRWYNLTGSQWSQSSASYNFSSQNAACQFAFEQSGHPSKGSVQLIDNSCKVIHLNGATISENPIFTVYACPLNTTNDSGGTPNASTMCTLPACPTGQIWSTVTNSCSQDCAPLKGKEASISLNCGSSEPSRVCMPNTCSASMSASFTVKFGNCSYGAMSGAYTGNSCSGEVSSSSLSNPSNANPPPADSPETDCIKQGKSFGTVNGSTVCVGTGTPGAAPVKSVTTKETTNQSGDNPAEVTNETKATTKVGDQVITETTKKKPDGTEEKTNTVEAFSDYCEKNANSKLCKPEETKESKFTGNCMSEFTCEGDAIQCAMAVQQHQQYCENRKPNEFTDLLESEMNAANDQMADNNGSIIPNTTINLPTTIQGQKLLTSSCITDIAFPLSGHTFTLPLSKLCPALEFAGQMVLIISYLISGYILFGHKGAQ